MEFVYEALFNYIARIIFVRKEQQETEQVSGESVALSDKLKGVRLQPGDILVRKSKLGKTVDLMRKLVPLTVHDHVGIMLSDSEVFEMKFPISRAISIRLFLKQSDKFSVIRLKSLTEQEVSLLKGVLLKRLKIKYDLGCAIRTFTRLVLTQNISIKKSEWMAEGLLTVAKSGKIYEEPTNCAEAILQTLIQLRPHLQEKVRESWDQLNLFQIGIVTPDDIYPDLFEVVLESGEQIKELLLEKRRSTEGYKEMILQSAFDLGSLALQHGELLLSIASILSLSRRLMFSGKRKSKLKRIGQLSLLLAKVAQFLVKASNSNVKVARGLTLLRALRGFQALLSLLTKENTKLTLAEVAFRKIYNSLLKELWKPSL